MTEPSQRLTDEQIVIRYEINKTVNEIKQNQWKRVALQFPDQMLSDSARIYQLLTRGLKSHSGTERHSASHEEVLLEDSVEGMNIEADNEPVKLTILGDTSYGSCCVDEVAAEHVDADVVVHYGRSCLSPTARLPVIHVFTARELDIDAVCESFKSIFSHLNAEVIVTADTPFSAHVEPVVAKLVAHGYVNLFAAATVHDPSSLIPNRTVPDSVKQDQSRLGSWSLFHISHPPTSLLLTLSSRVKDIHVYPTSLDGSLQSSPHQANTSIMLRRRYGLVTSLGTVSTWGILINTLSVKNYLHMLDHVRQQISDAGKKSYLFVVGKLNAAKVANFAEIGGWVVIGCWESSLVDSRDFFKPIITPFELDLVLAGDDKRVWTGEWRSDFQTILENAQDAKTEMSRSGRRQMPGAFVDEEEQEDQPEEPYDFDSEEESAPPEFDLRTGRYVSHTRPTRGRAPIQGATHISRAGTSSTALMKKSNGELLAVNGIASPAAEFLAQKRTWRGLGSDFEIRYDDESEPGGLVEEGRTGVARGYTVGESSRS